MQDLPDRAGGHGTADTDDNARPGWQRVCPSAELVERGEGIRFEVSVDGDRGALRPAFVIRHDGCAHAYLNQCAHVPVELDWQPGRFFDDEARYLICATHGATYRPHDGVCVAGPCRGRRLQALECDEHADAVWVRVP